MEAMVVSALNSAALAEKYGLRSDQIILSAKVSGVQDLIDVYRSLAARCNLSAAPRADRSRAWAPKESWLRARRWVWFCRKASATPFASRLHPLRWRSHRRSSSRATNSAVAWYSQLHAASHRLSRLRPHHQHLLPGNGAADSILFARSDAGRGKAAITGVEEMKVAVMGCVVNGPGESKHANIGISLPGNLRGTESPGLRGRPPVHDSEGRQDRGRVYPDPRRLR